MATGTLYSHTGDEIVKLSMNLFGIPHQFTPEVDPRNKEISSTLGKKFIENIILEAPVATIIPGKPKYLPNESVNNKISISQVLLEGASGSFDGLNQLKADGVLDEMRLYDFETDYSTYIKYVNVLCRGGAAFLDINDTIMVGSKEYSFHKFNWENYKWSSDALYGKTAGTNKTALNNLKNGTSGNTKDTEFQMDTTDSYDATIENILTSYQYVQFYVDPDSVAAGDSLSNATSESMMKGMFDSGQNTMKDLAFMANSGGIDTAGFQQFSEDSLSALSAGIQQILGNNNTIVGGAGGALARVFNLAGDVVKGNNVIIPNIYNSSDYSRTMSLTVHLRSPYGTKLGYFLNIYVPMMHLLALALPKQASANTYASPFLVKAFVEGMWTCNLGIVRSISINKNTESLSTDGLPMEVDVTLDIEDLYSDLTMTPSDAPIRFIHNTSLIEFLATNCGMSLTKPNYQTKYEFIIDSILAKFGDIDDSIKNEILERIFRLTSKFTSLR